MTDQPARPRRGRAIHLLLFVPLFGVLIPTISNTKDPTLIGIPFFYWYQMLWVPLNVLCTSPCTARPGGGQGR